MTLCRGFWVVENFVDASWKMFEASGSECVGWSVRSRCGRGKREEGRKESSKVRGCG